MPEPTTDETDGEMLARLGTDGEAWAREFLSHVHMDCPEDEALDTMRAWFANAIEAGRSAGYSEGKREDNPDWPANVLRGGVS